MLISGTVGKQKRTAIVFLQSFIDFLILSAGSNCGSNCVAFDTNSSAWFKLYNDFSMSFSEMLVVVSETKVNLPI